MKCVTRLNKNENLLGFVASYKRFRIGTWYLTMGKKFTAECFNTIIEINSFPMTHDSFLGICVLL